MTKSPEPTMTVGETIAINDKGEGIVSTKKGDLVVAGALPGDYVEVLMGTSRRKKRKKKSFLKKIITAGRPRINAFCQHFSLCGGCSRQDISYDDQLEIKSQLVHGLLSPLVEPNHPQLKAELSIIACDEPQFYRNRMDFFMGSHKWLESPIKTEKEESNAKNTRPKVDMRGAGLHVKGLYDRVIHIEKCHLQESNGIRNDLHHWAIQKQIEYYNSRDKTGWLKGLTVRTTLTHQTMVIIEVLDKNSTLIEEMVQYLTQKHSEITSIYLVINSEKKESILNLAHEHIYGTKFIEEQCGPIKLNIYPEVFYQTNSVQAVRLYDWVSKSMDLTTILSENAPNDNIKRLSVLDLYCGIGSIGLYLAAKQPNLRVTGVDIVPRSIEAAMENAKINQLDNVEFHTGSIQEIVEKDLLQVQYDWIILDPPRAGLHPKVIDYLNHLVVLATNPKIIYISCNPFTLARDIKSLSKYKLEHWQPVDMFPHTHHVETVTKLLPNI